MLGALYKEIILEHHKEPRNFGVMKNPTGSIEKYNPLCGDKVTVQIKLDETGKKIEDIQFSGTGCSISVASASILTDEVKGMTVENALAHVQKFRDVMQGHQEPSVLEGDVEALAGVKNFPVRIKCALLAWTALKEILEAQNHIKLTDTDLKEWLKPIEDPEIHMSLVELGLIYSCDYEPKHQKVDVKMSLTSPGCPAAGYMVDQVKKRLLEHDGVKDADVEIVWEPKWDPKIMASEEAKEKLGIW